MEDETLYSGEDNVPYPRPLSEVVRKNTICLGSVFLSKEHFKIALCEYSELLNKRFTQRRRSTSVSLEQGHDNDSSMKFFCTSGNCEFHIRAGRIKDGRWSVLSLRQHTCSEIIPSTLSAYTPRQLAPILYQTLQNNQNSNISALRLVVQKYINQNPSNYFLYRVKAIALTMVRGSFDDILKLLPDFIQQLNILKHSANILVKSTDQYLDVAIKLAREEHHKRTQHSLASSTSTFNEQTIRNDIEEICTADGSHLYGILYTPIVGNEMIKNMVPVYQTDAAHCFGPYRGTIFSIYGRDSNRRMVLLGMMLLFDNESEETWTIFFEHIANSLRNITWHQTMIISDQDKGLGRALQTILPDCKQFICKKHRIENVFKNTSGIVGAQIKRCFETSSRSEIMEILENVKDSPIYNYITKTSFNCQFPAFSSGRYGMTTTQGVESMNNAIKSVRSQFLAHGFIQAVLDDRKRHLNAMHEALNFPDSLDPPRIATKLRTLAEAAAAYPFTITEVDVTEQKAVVQSVGIARQYNVNLLSKHCDCGYWNLNNFPCIHAARLSQKIGVPLSQLLCDYDKTITWKKQYSNLPQYIIPSTASLVPKKTKLAMPIVVPPARGRPRTTRLKGCLEKKAHCSLCGKSGHNRRSCKSVWVRPATNF